MRLAALALSAAVISGCSYTQSGEKPFLGGLFSGSAQGQYTSPHAANRCIVPHARAPLPAGCHPSQVRIAQPGQAQNFGQQNHGQTGGFPQQPVFGQPAAFRGAPQQATGNFGTHASGNAHTALHQGASTPKTRRPRFRGALDLGVEQSISGSAIDRASFPTDPFIGYNPANYNEGRTEGSQAAGEVRNILYYANSRLQNTVDPWDSESVPTISLQDAWSTPTTIGISGEFIVNDKATLFARGGYAAAEGSSGGAASLDATVFKRTNSFFYTADPSGVGYVLTGTATGTEFQSENLITEVSYDFSDLNRYELEAGGRFYFDPVSGRETGRTVTPFVSASGGMSHYNAASYTLDQRQLSYESVFEEDENSYYDLDPNPAQVGPQRVELYDAQWVPTGRLAAGVEWQVTPKTALALEAGLRYEGAREYANGNKGDANIVVPVSLRGSFNF